MLVAPVMLKVVVVAVTGVTTRELANEVSSEPAWSNTVLPEVPRQLLTRVQILIAHRTIFARLLVIPIAILISIIVVVVRLVIRNLLRWFFALPASRTSTGGCCHCD